MDYAKKVAGSKKPQHGDTRNWRGSSAHNNQTGTSMHYAHFSRQNVVVSSNTRVVRPPGFRPPRETERSTQFKSPYPSKAFTTNKETPEEKKNRLSRQLNKFDSPFNWRPRQVKPFDEPETIINRMQEKDREIVEERKFKWRSFIFHLVISYELWRAKKISQAFEEICALESVIAERANRVDFMFASIEDALRHVVHTSKAFLYLEQDMVIQAESVMGKLLPYEMLNRVSKAGIHGIRAAVFMEYGHRGNKNALNEALEAVKLDRTAAEWHFFISKCMGRIRRVSLCHELVDPQEIKAINVACRLDKRNANYKVFLGQVLAERGLREYKKDLPGRNTEQYKRIMKSNKFTYHCLKEAVKLSPDSPRVLIRCARSLMKLPPALKDLKFMKECIDKAIKLAPNNPMVHHVQAMYHERYDCDTDLPLEAYDKAAFLGNFSAAMDRVRLQHKLKSGDIIEELEILASKNEQTDKLQGIYAQAGSYLLFIKKDIIGALKYYLKVIEIDPKSYAMMSHKPIFFRMKDPVNMFEVLLEELDTKTDWQSFSTEDRVILRNFRIKASIHDPVPTEKKKRLTVEEILEISRKLVVHGDMYKERVRERRNFKRKLYNQRKRWRGKKKKLSKDVKPKTSKEEKLQPEKIARKYDSRNCKLHNYESRRRDSSVDTVDSDYHRDSTTCGPRGFYIPVSNESSSNTKSEGFISHMSRKDHNLEFSRSSIHTGRFYYNSNRSLRDTSISSVSSTSSVGFSNNQGHEVVHPPTNTVEKSQLLVENVKKFDMENSYNSSVHSLSMLSLSSAGSESLVSSMECLSIKNDKKQSDESLVSSMESLSMMDRRRQSNASSVSLVSSMESLSLIDRRRVSSASQGSSMESLSVMDRVKQSYAMLGRNSEPTNENKKHLKKYGSTQSLSSQYTGKKLKNITKSGSSQSLNQPAENMDSKPPKSFKRLTPGGPGVGSSRSSSFMPSFAPKDS